MIYLEHTQNVYTCKAKGRYLHSKYNPRREAEQFVDSLNCGFVPFCIVVLGPCLSYCLPALQKRFPSIPLYAVQYDDFFLSAVKTRTDTDKSVGIAVQNACNSRQWDDVFLCTAVGDSEQEFFEQSAVLSEHFFSVLGEQKTFGAFFTAWQPAEKVFEKESRIAWEAIKLLLQKSRDVLATRAFFSQRWLKNSLHFFTYMQNPYEITAGSKPVLAAASGPSLRASIPFIQKYRDAFFLIALSSALPVLIHSSVYPDMCITTDGGFYAQYHLQILKKLHKKGIVIPIACAAESKVATFFLENFPIIPLRYGDGIEGLLFDYCQIKAVQALRNGSVSGTAAHFALSISPRVFFCGLDLEVSKGYQHTQPNALEQNAGCFDGRLKPLAARIYTTSEKALKTYRRWFSVQNTDFSSRVFRLSETAYSEKLGFIRDISWNEIRTDIERYGKQKAPHILPLKKIEQVSNKKKILSFLTEQRSTINKSALWYENCALLEYLSSLKYPESQEFRQKCTNTVLKTFDELFNLYR